MYQPQRLLPSSGRNRVGLAGTFCLAAGLLAGPAGATTIDFDIHADGRVVPSEDFAVKVTVLGAAITYGSGGPNMPVTVELHVGDQAVDPFGTSSSAGAGGDVNTGQVYHYIVDEMFSADAEVTVTGRSFRPLSYGGSMYAERNSHEESLFVNVLRDGDPIPDINAFATQADVSEYVQEYTDPTNGVMMLHENQAIYLFELGTSNPYSTSADFQDLVVLITFGESPEQLASDPLPDPGTVEPLYD